MHRGWYVVGRKIDCHARPALGCGPQRSPSRVLIALALWLYHGVLFLREMRGGRYSEPSTPKRGLVLAPKVLTDRACCVGPEAVPLEMDVVM